MVAVGAESPHSIVYARRVRASRPHARPPFPARERPRGIPGAPRRRRRRLFPGERLRVNGTLSTVSIIVALVVLVFVAAWAEPIIEPFILPGLVAVGLVALGLRERARRERAP